MNWQAIAAILVMIMWVSVILLIFFLYRRIIQEDAERVKNEIKLKDKDIEAIINNSDLNSVVDMLNDKDRKS